jgi:hypothetical protein
LAASVSVGRQAMIEFKGSHFEREVILRGVRWYVAYPISYRQLEEMMQERGGRLTIPRLCGRPWKWQGLFASLK